MAMRTGTESKQNTRTGLARNRRHRDLTYVTELAIPSHGQLFHDTRATPALARDLVRNILDPIHDHLLLVGSAEAGRAAAQALRDVHARVLFLAPAAGTAVVAGESALGALVVDVEVGV